MRAAPWPRLIVLAGVVAGLHWAAIGKREAARPVAPVPSPASVWVRVAPPVAEPVVAESAVVEPVSPPEPPPQSQTRRIAAASLQGAALRPAFELLPAPVAQVLPVVLQAEAEDTAPPLWLAQAAIAVKPAGAEGRAAPLPTYRTKPPAAATLDYRLSRGAIVGTGRIDWRPAAGGSYSLQLEGSVPIVGTLITQTSRGRLDATGLAPERHTDRRLRRGEQAANFDRGGARISFSGQAPELPLSAGVQDRVSVMVQLPAIVNAWARVPPVGEHVLIRVVGARGDDHVWSLRFEGAQPVDLPEGRVNALRFLREPEGANDTRAEFWLDPARQHLPVKVLLTDGKGEALELLRTP